MGAVYLAKRADPAALENYRRAFTVFSSLSTETAETKRDLSTLHTRFANALVASGDRPKAIENFRKAIAILTELLAANSDDRDVKGSLGVANILLGDSLGEPEQFTAALGAHRTALRWARTARR
jgi:tetratricopeptide (TPR) repeat protein